jgi:ribonuclease BN (tRNA processing enzyme)
MKLSVIGFWGAYPEKNSASSSYLLEEEGFRLLIDCGSGCLAQLQNYVELDQLDAVILSHYHHDHVADVGSLQYAMLVNALLGKRGTPLPIYAHNQDDERFRSLSYHQVTEAREIKAGEWLTIGPWQVSFCQTEHPVYCLAMRFSNQAQTKHLVYTADTYWSDDLVSFSGGADVLLCESSLYDEGQARQSGHMTPSLAGRLAREAKVKELILTHLPHFGDHQELMKQAKGQFDGPVHLAETGLIIEI